MEIKRSDKLTFYRINKSTFVKIDKHIFHLFPVQSKDGQTIKKIWRRAEEIDSFTQLMSYCGGGERIRLHVTSRKL